MLIVSFFGCASTKGAKVTAEALETPGPEAGAPNAPATTQPSTEANKNEIPQQKNEVSPANRVQELSLPDFIKPAPPKLLPLKIEKEPIDPKRINHAEGNVVLNAESMPLSDFIIYALGDTLKITFFIDEQVKNMKNPVTLRMTAEMPADKVIDIVIGFLEKQDLVVEEKGGALYITKEKPPVAKPPLDVRFGRSVPQSPADILQVVPLKYIRFTDVDYIVRSVYKNNVSVMQNFKDNVLLLSGPASSVKEAVDIIDLFDVPYIANKKILLLKLVYWQADEFIKQITSILQGINIPVASSVKDPGIVFLPIRLLNSVLLIAPDEESLKYAVDWYKKLDTDESAGSGERAYTYTPKFSKASDMVESLSRLYMGGAREEKEGKLAPATAPVPASSGITPPIAPPPSGIKPPAAPQGGQSFLSSGGMRVAADDKRNIILIRATPSDYRNILNYLEKLDVLPKQVLIEATIAELTLTDELNYGLEWYLHNKVKTNLTGSGTETAQTLGNLGVSSSQGLVYKFLADSKNIQVLLNAFAQENKVNIVSTPRMMVLDNEEANIQVGENVPIISGQTQSTSAEVQTTITTQSVQYQSTGIIVRVKPNINTEGILTLNISLEDSEAQTNSLSSVNSPIFLTRTLSTIVVAGTGQTIILGGMIQDNISTTDTKVPLLGDLPLIGNFFKNTTRSKARTELIILMTPTIITHTEDAARITDEMKQQLEWFK